MEEAQNEDDTIHYQIDEELGSGGFGKAYLATDISTQKHIVVKTEKLDVDAFKIMSNEKLIFQQLHAAKKLQGLQGLIPDLLSTTINDNHRHVLIMEYAGVTLRDLHKEAFHQFTKDEINFIAGKVLDILKFIHKQGVIHQDIKPSNISVSFENNQYELKIIDFGYRTFCITLVLARLHIKSQG